LVDPGLWTFFAKVPGFLLFQAVSAGCWRNL
jgi:hypothetical protein